MEIKRKSSWQLKQLKLQIFTATYWEENLRFIGTKLWNALSKNVENETSSIKFMEYVKPQSVTTYKTVQNVQN